MNRLTRQMRSFAPMIQWPTVLGISLIVMYFVYACLTTMADRTGDVGHFVQAAIDG